MIAPEERIANVRSTFGRTIQEIVDKHPEHDIYEILGAVEVLVGSKIARRLCTSPAERMVFAFTGIAREVQNGGFHQFFFNSAGDYWKDVLDGLSAIGDEQGLILYRQVLSIFPESSPSGDWLSRQDQLGKLEDDDEDKVWSHFSRMTSQYFDTPFPNWQLVFDYVKSHAAEFDLRNA